MVIVLDVTPTADVDPEAAGWEPLCGAVDAAGALPVPVA
jgi:hypothetical protein